MRYSIITLFLCVYSSLGVYSIDFANFYQRKSNTCHSIVIIESSWSGWKSITEYDEKGYAVRIKSIYKKECRSDYYFQYESTDTSLTISKTNAIDTQKIYPKIRFTYDSMGHCITVEQQRLGDSTFECVEGNFVWNKDKLMEKKQYYNGSLRAIAKYLYDSDGRLSQYKEYSHKDSTICRFFCTYVYDNEGHLVDETMEYTDSTAMMTDVITWSDKATNKCHMRYMWNKNDGNGKNATWRKSYFLTDRGKKLCTKRTVRKTAYFVEKCRMENMQPCSIFKKH